NVIVIGGLGATFYLYIFNRRTRQSLHDLVVGSFVVPAGAVEPPPGLAVPRRHLVLVGGWFAIGLAAPIAAAWLLQRWSDEPRAPLAELQAAVAAQPGVRQANVVGGTGWTTGTLTGPSSTSWLQIDVQTTSEDLDALMRWTAGIALDRHPDLLG